MHTTSLNIFSNTLIITGNTAKYETIVTLAIETAKPAITSIIICPETMFANRRIPRLTGRNRKDINSIKMKNGIKYPGIPVGQKRLKY